MRFVLDIVPQPEGEYYRVRTDETVPIVGVWMRSRLKAWQTFFRAMAATCPPSNPPGFDTIEVLHHHPPDSFPKSK